MLEHIPGSYKVHLDGFIRILKPNGLMIFSVPGPYKNRLSEEGGEHLKSDEERTSKYYRYDHLKIFGSDFVSYLKELKTVEYIEDGITNDIRKSLHVRPNKAPFFILRKK